VKSDRQVIHDLIAERDQLRAALRALVEALPKCGYPGCQNRGTWVHTGPDGDESYYCDAEASPMSHRRWGMAFTENDWAPALRSALLLLDGGKK
jgi:hypothetical protein